MKKKILIVSCIAIVIIAGVIAWRVSASKAQTKTAAQNFTLKKADLLDSVLVSGTVISNNSKNVYSNLTNYPVKGVYFKVGDRVKAGDVLAELDTTSLEQDIRQAELNIKNAEQALKNEKSANTYNLQNASNSAESAALELKDAQDTYDKTKKLYEAGAVSQDEFLKAESALKKAKLSYEKAQSSLNNEKNKNTTTASNNVEIQKAALEKQKNTLKDGKITSPIDGIVTLANAKENGPAAGLLFVVEDTDNLILSTAIGEYDIDKVKLGQEVIIKADSLEDSNFIGTVSKISPVANKDENGNVASTSNVQFDTEITLKDKDPNIKIGMNVRLTIKLNEKHNVYSVPYDAIVTEDGKQWIYVSEKSQKDSNSQSASKKIQVQKGMETDMYVEVSSPDLKDGMNVQINPKDSTEKSK
jgi:multidrug efflux pump subunit AcrA (membrane-fusion protein)